jgi:hypothetical protein
MDTRADVVDDDDPIVPGRSAVTLRRADVPVDLGELAALKGDAIAVVDARVQILETLRSASIRATHPEDWVLFKAPAEHGGQIVGYLEDYGGDRVRGLWGIRIFNVSKAEKVVGTDPSDFMYIVTGDGECGITHEIVEAMEGGRSSKDDFCKGKTGAALEMLVRKAARANLDGGITRELSGLKAVPIQELERAWAGTAKTIDRCRRGRGFGTHDERVGGASDKAPDVDPPICPHCKTRGVYRPAKGNRAAFYGCPNYDKHADKKFIVNAADWIARATAAAAVPTPPPAGTTTPPHVDDIPFDGPRRDREPGQEG